MGTYGTVKTLMKDAVTVAQQSDNADLYKKVLDSYMAAVELMEENQKLKAEIKKAKEEKVTDKNMIFNNNVYYKKDGRDEIGPFCSKCWDVDHKLVRLYDADTFGTHFCPNCKTYVTHDK